MSEGRGRGGRAPWDQGGRRGRGRGGQGGRRDHGGFEGGRSPGRGSGPGYDRPGPGSAITVLDAFVRHNRSLQDQHAMRRFVNAAMEYIVQDTGYVLRALGDPNTPGLERLREICRSDFTAGTFKDLVSFQRVIIPLLRLVTMPRFSSSTLTQLVGPVLATLHSELPLGKVQQCIAQLAASRVIQEPSLITTGRDEALWKPTQWTDIIEPVTDFMRINLQRFRCDEPEKAAECLSLLEALAAAADAFEPGGAATKSAGYKKVMSCIGGLREQLDGQQRRVATLQRREVKDRQQQGLMEGLVTAFRAASVGPSQDGPGHLRGAGPRHDNDHAEIQDIALAPTQSEVLSAAEPYLPRNRPGSLPHQPPGSADGHLELHFRLLRQDLVASLNASVLQFSEAGGVRSLRRANDRGGRFAARGPGGRDEVMLFVYRNVSIEAVRFARHAGAFFQVSFDELPQNAKQNSKAREEFWSKSKRLQKGTLVSLWREVPDASGVPQPVITFATVADWDPKLLAASNAGRPSIGIRVCTDDANGAFLQAALDAGTGSGAGGGPEMVLLQSQGSFFSYAPVLQALQRSQLPLARYLVYPHTAEAVAAAAAVGSPAYLQGSTPWDLSMLIDEGTAKQHRHRSALEPRLKAVSMAEPGFPLDAIESLSTLDRAQARAVQAALTQEVAFIQGPPGTGKTYVGVQIAKLLLHNTVPIARATGRWRLRAPQDDAAGKPVIGPLLCVCYTNHALDQFLMDLQRAGITNMVRIGGGCKEPLLEACNLLTITRNTQCRTRTQGQMAWNIRAAMGDIEKEAEKVKHALSMKTLGWQQASELLSLVAPRLLDSLEAVEVPEAVVDPEEDGFQAVNRKHHWDRWLEGPPRPAPRASAAAAAAALHRAAGPAVLQHAGQFDLLSGLDGSWADPADPLSAELELFARMYAEQKPAPPPPRRTAAPPPPPPASNRPLERLLQSSDAWNMSRAERWRVHDHLLKEVKDGWHVDLRRKMMRYEESKKALLEVYDDVDLSVLRAAQVVGMTTSGVANKQTLIAALAPKVVLVEEAAEVLEAHILTSMAPSTEQLILIGDHEQLRPKAEQYELTVESRHGYDLDLSLFERLQKQGFPVASLRSQRRMQPAISALIRAPVYPDLQDYPSVQQYPPVRGMASSLFFWSHDHPEGGAADESKSKYNDEEAKMAVRLAKHLLLQGYKSGEITILTPYVGQLLKLRQQLGRYMTVILNDRDLEAIPEDEEEPSVADKVCLPGAPASVPMQEAVRVATIDNFQGEEATVIILSLVRNNKDGNIGFLKTKNRINVMLSRARHGMYILGHPGTLLAKTRSTDMWPQVMEMLVDGGHVGEALELVCPNHPEAVARVYNAADFDTYAHDGGCSRQCDTALPCGHRCPRSCHVDDPQHITVQCRQPCMRLYDPCGHPCSRLCYQSCGDCMQNVRSVLLPCGHTATDVPCCQAQDPKTVMCREEVTVTIKHCGHPIETRCCNAERLKGEATQCNKPCSGTLACGHACKGTCGGCLQHTLGPRSAQDAEKPLPKQHEYTHQACKQSCHRQLFCGHECGKRCHEAGTGAEAQCPACSQPCAVACAHSRCKRKCSEPCVPCAEPCPWHCVHQGQCRLPCGAPCERLPCDKRCDKVLGCGHRCPGVCGEDCPPSAFCAVCGKPDKLVLDLVMNEEKPVVRFSEEELEEDPLLFLGCGHAFPISSLDGHTELGQSYGRSPEGAWEKPLPLEGDAQPLPRCPLCRKPITGLYRYGRPLKKRAIDIAERKYVQHCAIALGAGHAALQRTRTAYAKLNAEEGGKGSKARHLAAVLKEEEVARAHFGPLFSGKSRSPSIKVYQATSAVLQRLHAAGELSSSAAEVQRILAVPLPDISPALKAMVGYGSAVTLRMALEAQLVAAALDAPPPRGAAAEAKAAELTDAWMLVGAKWDEALKILQAARLQSEKHNAKATQVSAQIALAQLMQQRVRDLLQETNPTLRQALGFAPKHDETIKWAQGKLIEMSEQTARAALDLSKELRKAWGPHAEASADEAQAQALLDGVPDLKKWISQQVTVAERAEVIKALIKSDPSLGDGGWLGTGHQFRCPNGHIYFIGNCGGAVMTRPCPECGATIGGTGHRLAEGNEAVRS